MVKSTDTNQYTASDVVNNSILWPLMVPLYIVYFYGPSLGGYGFWEGKEWPVICGEITGIQTERYWGTVQDACQDVIWRKFVSFAVGCVIGLIVACCLLCLTRGIVNKVVSRLVPQQLKQRMIDRDKAEDLDQPGCVR
jgi:hypothetical protein